MRKTYGIILRLISQICIIALVSSLWFAACTKPETEQSGDRAIPVTSISLNKTTHSMTEGDSFRLIATIYPEDATNQNISWSSDSPQVATVDDAGLVLARQAGIATISVHTEDGNITASCQFTIAAQVMPSVTIGASNISAVSAVLSGKANLGNSSSADLKMGIMYSKSSGVLPSTSTLVEATDIEAEYYYSIHIFGLEPGTTYYYRSYVYQGGTNAYGETMSFTTKDILSPIITTSPAVVLGPTEVITNAKLDLTDCLYESLIYGFYYGSDAQHLDSFVSCDGIDDAHNYAWQFRSLTPATAYYYQASVVLDGREFTGEVLSYTTAEIEATVTTMPASNITEFKATLNGRFATTNADTLSKEVWFLWSKTAKTVDELKTSGTRVDCTLNDDCTFSTQLAGLDYDAEYHYVAITKVLDKEFSGEFVSFSTSGINATVTTLPASDISYSRACLNASFTVNSTENFSKSVWFLWSKTASTLDALKTSGTKVSCSLNSDGSFKSSLSGLCDYTTYYYVAAAKVYDREFYGTVKSFKTKELPSGAVDLGLSVLWATSNLSASGLSDAWWRHGDYYAWGETKTKSNYSWSTYKWCNGSSSTLTKYNTSSSIGAVDNKTEFKDYDYEDDAARKILGGKWRIPTDAEWTELIKNCTWTWTSLGMTVKSKKVGYTDKSISLPAGGERINASLYSDSTCGYYWSSSLCTDDPYLAWIVVFSSSNVPQRSHGTRSDGISVRPVTE